MKIYFEDGVLRASSQLSFTPDSRLDAAYGPTACMDELELIDSISKNINLLSAHSRYIPFWAYTYGIKSINSDKILVNYGLIPVMVNGGNNINKKLVVDREPIFSFDKEKIACKLCKNVHVCKKCVYNL